ncbi:hypothetical protein G919_02038 [Escherichia coli UMEA 3151-1]|nr:hypothetical protein G919_02038 [Escherichia coli UMEA 3151-1]
MEDASLTTKGVVKLSSAVDSTSESLAATPKAVKAANDNANSRLAKNQNGADIPDKGRFLSNINVYSKGEVDKKKGMRKYTFSAPANAVSGKWYPVVFRRTGGGADELASRVVITTYSSAGGYAMNNCEFNGFVMPGGWSDRDSYAAGFFSIYSTAERAIHSIIASVKDDDLCSVFYVETRAFPIHIFAEEGLNVIVPTADYAVGQTTYKWGATDPLSESTNAQIILDFKNGRGYYCSHPFISSLSGNAATATKLQTARSIGGVVFDGSANINLPGVNTTGNQNTTGNAATATKLQTARNINGVPFDGTKDITLTPKDLDAYSKSEVQSALAGKQPLDNTLTNLSGKDVAGLLAYLQLGEAAKRNVGTGNNQLPDMSAFGMSRNGQTAWDILPNGMIRQVGTVTLTPVGNFNAITLGGVLYYTHYYRVNFPRQFPNAQIATLATLASYSFSTQSSMAGKSLATHRDTDSGTDVSRTRFTVSYTTPNLGEIPTLHFEAIGY